MMFVYRDGDHRRSRPSRVRLIGIRCCNRLLPDFYVAASKGMIGSVRRPRRNSSRVGARPPDLDQPTVSSPRSSAQLQVIGRALILLDLAFAGYGPEAASGSAGASRALLARVRQRLWIDDPKGRQILVYSALVDEVLPMRGVLFSLRPADDDQRQHLAAARERFGTIVDTELTMVRSLVNPVPNLLLTIVVGWACLLFFCYAMTAAANLLTTIMAALGALSVASAAYLILELSDPYVGLFQMPKDAFDGLMQALTPADRGRNAPDETPA